MAKWMVSNVGAWRDLDELTRGPPVLSEWSPSNRSTIVGGLLILGYAHGVSATARRGRVPVAEP